MSHPPVVKQTPWRPHPLFSPLGGAGFGIFHHFVTFLLALRLSPPHFHQTRPPPCLHPETHLGSLLSAHQGTPLQSVPERVFFKWKPYTFVCGGNQVNSAKFGWLIYFST